MDDIQIPSHYFLSSLPQQTKKLLPKCSDVSHFSTLSLKILAGFSILSLEHANIHTYCYFVPNLIDTHLLLSTIDQKPSVHMVIFFHFLSIFSTTS